MKLKIISLFLTLVLLNSCASSKYFAQEFSVQTLQQALTKVQGLNKQDGFYYDILAQGGYKLNLSQQRIVQNNFDDAIFAKLNMKSKKDNIIAYEKFNKKYNILTPSNLENALFKSQPICDNQNYALNNQTNIIEEIVKNDILQRYNPEHSSIKKLKLDKLEISNLKNEAYLASCMPYVKATFDITAVFKGKTVTIKNYNENFLIEISDKGDDLFTYKIGYKFVFDQTINRDKFEQSLFVTLNKTNPSLIKQEIYDNINLENYNINYQDKWLEISKYAKTVAEKYLYFVNVNFDLSNTICTQDSEYFANTFFIGDSIFEGFTFYNLAHQNNVLSKVGVGTRNILELELLSNEKEYTLESFLLKYQPKRVYIMLGLNDVNMISEKEYQDNYDKIVKLIHQKSPHTDIIITSISPIRKLTFSTPVRLQKYNEKAKEVAKQNDKTYYLDLFDFLSTDGILCTKYSANDGIHFSVNTYKVLMDYINVHQLQSEFVLQDLFSEEKLLQMKNKDCLLDENLLKSVQKAYKEKGKASPLKIIVQEPAPVLEPAPTQ